MFLTIIFLYLYLCYIIILGDSMKDKRIENVLNFYMLCNKLKNVVRTGWKAWNVERERIESIAEHIYSTQMLAIAMYKEFDYNLDLEKIIYMLAVHELEEIVIGDLTAYDISREEKEVKGRLAVKEVLKNVSNSLDIESLTIEFSERKTKEAIFAYYCDKLDCDIQAKLYDEEGCVDLNNQDNNPYISVDRVKKLLNNNKKWSEAWIENDRNIYIEDKNFLSVLDYIKDNDFIN